MKNFIRNIKNLFVKQSETKFEDCPCFQSKCFSGCDEVPYQTPPVNPVLAVEATTKQCYTCEKILPIDKFHNSKNAKDLLQSSCKDCQKKHYLLEKRIRERIRLEYENAKNKKPDAPDNLFNEEKGAMTDGND